MFQSARIKLHRYCAFSDKALFSEKYCDLKSSGEGINQDGNEHNTVPALTCGCGKLFNGPPLSSTSSSQSSTLHPQSSSASSIGFVSSISDVPELSLPFSSHLSAKYCLKAALNVAQSLDALPYPNPTGHQGSSNPSSSSDNKKFPRTMPSFACCTMQSSYAMLMISRKLRPKSGEGFMDQWNDHLISSLTSQIRDGLEKLLLALDNYSMSFEALSGMRGEQDTHR